MNIYRYMRNINNVLIVGDINFFDDDNIEVEMISDHKQENVVRYINILDFINDKKKPFYFKYNNIIIEEKYLDIFGDVKYFFEDNNFKLLIILNKEYQIEKSDTLIKILDNKLFDTKIFSDDNFQILEITR
ncbi:hypothetical protein OKW22_000425 [Bacilli bacterium PM5-3]|nr:hypothetical protein [Bacilli bacterium PM5-3]MDH6603056.1 hypothetical protein [Bacilli bacterium PM5-9]